MTKLKNDRFLRALRRRAVDRTPVWIMRQAGRYLPEYREIRKQAGSFMNLCTNPELACEVTMQPLRRFDLDAAILFSDILTIPDAMGLGLYFSEGEGPKFKRTVRSASDVAALPRPDPGDSLAYVVNAVSRIHRELDNTIPLIGFSGSPWTLATYMVEGGPSKSYSKVKGLMYEQPSTAHALLSKLADSVTDYLNAQIEAGAQAVQIFDSWGGILSHDKYIPFSLDYMQRIVSGLNAGPDGEQVPVILFSKGCNGHLEAMADTGCQALGIDWTLSLNEARSRVGERVAIQGNLDPAVLQASPDVIRRQVQAALESFGRGHGHVFNLGHGITPDVKPEHLGALVEAVAELSPAFHDRA
ncbi:MAG: uroporphyrinogen decarboxylase [Gammaproteobacteria bacterium]|nr:uroporphyrinogen decarboxylase [Gammaproteobacteria bacterium]